MRLTPLTGKAFGRLTVVAREENDKRGRARWRCLCTCGVLTTVRSCHLLGKLIESCGCLQRERVRETKTTHGHTRVGMITPEYRSWCHMRDRCTNPKDKRWAYYGGRGITVCARWRESFENFLADVGRRPSGTTLDRADNNGNYEPSNVKWSTQKEQQRNRRDNLILTAGGCYATAAEWAEVLGIKPKTLRMRIARGWTHERTLTTGVSPVESR